VAELNDQSVKVYRQVFQGTNAVGEFLVAALLVLVTMDLLPLGFQYNTLRCEATKTRSSATIVCIAGSQTLSRSRVAGGHGEFASLKTSLYARTHSAKYSSRPDAAYGVTNDRAVANAARIFGS